MVIDVTSKKHSKSLKGHVACVENMHSLMDEGLVSSVETAEPPKQEGQPIWLPFLRWE
jgi:hypothetical protein